MYRAGGPTDVALPFARKNVKPWTTAFTAAAAVGLLLPVVMTLMLLRSRDANAFGVGQLLVFVESLAIPLVLGTAGAVLVRGRRLPLGPLFALALFPFATALVIAIPTFRLLAGSDPQKMNVAASLFEHTELTILYGALSAGASCVVLALAMGAMLASVDRDRLHVLPRSPWTAILAGSVWFLLAFAVRATNASAFGPSAFLALSLVAPIGATALAAVLTWCSGVFARAEERKERRAAFACVAIAALASGAAVLLFDRASWAAATYDTLRAVRDGQSDAYASLLALSSARPMQTFALGIDIAGTVTVFGVALRSAWSAVPTAPCRREMLRSRGLHVAGASALVAWLLVVIVSLAGSAARGVCARGAETASIAPGDLELPAMRQDIGKQWFIPSESLVVHVDGRVGRLVRREAVAPYSVTLSNVYADRRAPFSVLVEAVRMSRVPTHFNLISRREIPSGGPTGREALGDLAAFLPLPDHATPVSVRIGASIPGWILAVFDEAPAVRLQWQGRERVVSLGGDEDAAARSAAFDAIVGADASGVSIRLLPRPADTIERVLSTVQALGARNLELGYEPPTSSGRGTAGSASSPRRR